MTCSVSICNAYHHQARDDNHAPSPRRPDRSPASVSFTGDIPETWLANYAKARRRLKAELDVDVALDEPPDRHGARATNPAAGNPIPSAFERSIPIS